MLAHTRIFHQHRMEILAKDVLRDVVFGRTESARGEHDICTTESIVQRTDNLLTIVVYGGDLAHLNALFI